MSKKCLICEEKDNQIRTYEGRIKEYKKVIHKKDKITYYGMSITGGLLIITLAMGRKGIKVVVDAVVSIFG